MATLQEVLKAGGYGGLPATGTEEAKSFIGAASSDGSAAFSPMAGKLISDAGSYVDKSGYLKVPELNTAVYGPPTPPAFKADVPATMDSNTAAKALSEPDVLPQIPDQKVFQMADGRFFSPTTGISASTREGALGLASAGGETSGKTATEASSTSGVSPSPALAPDDDVSNTIKSLFPESDSLVKQYQDLRKSSGVVGLENDLNDVNTKIADLNATIQNIESDVRASAGGLADASFIAATVADRTRRLAPLANQLSARQQALSSSIQAKKDVITEQLGLSKSDMAQANADREYVRKGVSDLLETFGAEAFKNASPELLSDIERRAGLPTGVLSGRIQTLKQQEQLRSGKLDEDKLALERQKLEDRTPAEKYGTGIIGEYQYYAEQETLSGRKPLTFDQYQDKDANRKARLAAAVASGGLTTNQFNRLNTISDNARLDPNVKDFAAIRAGYETARGAAQAKDSLGDIIMMRMVAKITDPSTGVREEEYRTFTGAIGTLPGYGIALTKNMIGKGKLTDSGRAALLAEINKIYGQRKNAYQNSVDAYKKQAEKAGGTAEDILPVYIAPDDQEKPTGEIVQKGDAQYQKNPDGSYTRIK